MFKTHSHKTNNTHQIKKIIEPIALFEYEKEFIEKIKEFKSKLCNKYFGETKTHYKLYKSGKNWVVMGISVFVLGGMFVTSHPVSADSVATSVSSSTVGPETTNASSSDTNSAAQSATTAVSSASDTKSAAQSVTTAASSAGDTKSAAQSAATAVSRASDTNSAAQSATTAASRASDAKSAAQSAATAASSAGDTNSAAQSAATAASSTSDTNSAAQSATTAVSHASDTNSAAQSATTAAIRASDANSAAQSAATAVSRVRNRRSVVQPMADNTLDLTNVTKDNLEDYMSLGGSATYDKTTGIVTITPDENDKVGNFALKSKIDMNNSFTLTGQINLGNKTFSQGGADGIGLAFHTGNTTDIGISGANLGIGGLQNAIGFKLDTYNNGHNTPQANEDGAKVASTDSNGYGYDADPNGSRFPQFGAFVNTSQKQVKAQDGKSYSRWWATTDKNSVQKLNSGDLDGKFHDFVVSYDGNNRKLIIKYTETGGNVLTWSTSIPDEYQAMAMVVSASTGGNKNLQQFKISSLDFKQAATVNVKYVDQKGNQLAQGSVSYPSGKVLAGSVTNTGFSVSDPDYPSGMWIDPDNSHYSYRWVQAKDGGKNGGTQIVFSTNRTGDGIAYVTELSESNMVLKQYTLNQNTQVKSATFDNTIYYNDVYFEMVQSSSNSFVTKYTASKFDNNYYNTLSYFVPKLITQTTYYVDKDGKQIIDSNGNPVAAYTQKGLVGQNYTTGDVTVVNGYYAIAPANSNGVMSPYGKIGASYVKNFHDGVVITYTQTGSDGTMSASIVQNGSVLKTWTSIKPSDPTIMYPLGSTTYGIKNPYIPQTSDIKYIYNKLGNWVVSNPDGSTTSIIYPNDPSDPTKIADSFVPGYPVIDFLPGYTPKDHMGTPLVPVDPDDRTKGYIPPTPSDIGKDTTITYTADSQKATVTYVVEGTGTVLHTDNLEGKSGEPIDYSTVAKLAELKALGYDLVTDGFTTATDKNFDKDTKVDQSFVVTVKPHVEPIKPVDPENPNDPNKPKPGDPIDPNNPDGPKWTEDLIKQIDTTRHVNRTITSVNEKGEEVAQKVTDKVTFTREGKINSVTGEITYGNWTAKDGDTTFDKVESPVVQGYILKDAKQKEVAATTGLTVDSKDENIEVVYTKLGSWVPKVPEGFEEPKLDKPQYPNDPTDPTKPGTPTTVIPQVPGTTPKDSNGNPLKPVDPNDPSKGYVPPTPENPTEDTVINYVPVPQPVRPTDNGDNNGTPTTAAQPASPSTPQYMDGKRELPNTGTEDNASLAALGLLGVLSGFGLVAHKKKED